MPTLYQHFFIIHYCGKGHYASASNQPGYFFRVSPCQPTPKNLNYSLLWEGGIMLLLRLSQVFRQGATMTPLHTFFKLFIIVGKGRYASASTQPSIQSGCYHAPTIFFRDLSLLWEGGIMFLLRLSKGNSSGCHHANPTPFFCICHYCGKVAFCFCFDVARVFLQGASMPPLHPYFLKLSLLRERDRYSQGIFSGCHHDTPTPYTF